MGGKQGANQKYVRAMAHPGPPLEPPLVVCRCSRRYTLYHTENSNHLDQNFGIIWRRRSMLVNDNTVEYNVSQ